MSLFDKVKSKINSLTTTNNQFAYADSSSISDDERKYYKSDDYYTYYSFPGTEKATKVITFEERKKTTFPSYNGLYPAEILLLDYCRQCKYPKPSTGYPGFWWFEFGIRDIGHMLESLKNRGFIRWASPEERIRFLDLENLKSICKDHNLKTSGKKDELVLRIINNVPENTLELKLEDIKYTLTGLGEKELTQNGYIPYMHKHPRKTNEESQYGYLFNVWSINKLFSDGNASNWKAVIERIEKEKFGIDYVNASNAKAEQIMYTYTPDEILGCIDENREYILEESKNNKDSFEYSSKGMALRGAGKDKEAIVQLYIAIEKKSDAPALYRDTAILLRKYKLYAEEIKVLDAGLKNVPYSNWHWNEIEERRNKAYSLLNKSKKKGELK